MWKLTVTVLIFGAVASAWKISSIHISKADVYNVSASTRFKPSKTSELNTNITITRDFEHSLQINPNNTNSYSKNAFNEYKLGNYQGAIDNYNLALKVNPNDAEIYSHRGAAKASLKKYQDAIADYDKAIEINPESVESYVNRGLLFASLGNYEKAIQDYNISIKIDPKYDNAYFNRGVAHYKSGNKKAAIADSKILAQHYKSQGAAVDAEEILNSMKQFDK
ncbi:MAG: tetratricopeptide repeat protein [Calothrix sp. CSU_2_0]|nr:tetratricopeptide repeat protein [Calothrix sp. CSU_2_0]